MTIKQLYEMAKSINKENADIVCLCQDPYHEDCYAVKYPKEEDVTFGFLFDECNIYIRNIEWD